MPLLSAIGIVSGLVFTALSFREDTRSRRVSNLMQLTEQHRETWGQLQQNPNLARVKDDNADLYTKPVTNEESQFVMQLMFHLHCWYRAILSKEVSSLDGLEKDIRSFFGRPVPRFVWEEKKSFFDRDFRRFVDDLLLR